MRKRFALFTGILLFAAASASAGVSVRLTGGLSFLLQGDYGRSLRGAYDALLATTDNLEGNFRPFRTELRGGFEVLIPFGDSFEVGLGGGYERLNVDNRFRYFWLFVTLEDAIQSRLTVVPITLNLHKSVALGRRLGLDLFGGTGYYSIEFRHSQSLGTDFFAFADSSEFSSKMATIGFQAGAVLEWSLSSGLDLVLQADGRFLRFGELKGEMTDKTSWFLGQNVDRTQDASFWVFDETVGTQTFLRGTFAGGQPAAPSTGNVRSAGLDLSGFGISAGLRLRF